MNLKSQKGMAMIPVLVIIFVASVLGVTVYAASGQERLNAQRDENKTQAYYFARSGVEIAIGRIINGECDSMTEGEEVTYYGDLGGTFSEDETDEYTIKFVIGVAGDDFIINSTGIVRTGSASGAAQAQSKGLGFKISKTDISAIGDGGGGGGNIPIALFAIESLNMKNNAKIFGSVATNTEEPDNISFKNNSAIKNGDIYIGPGAKIQDFNFLAGRIPNGDIKNLPSALSFPMSAFPEFPQNLPVPGDPDLVANNAVIEDDGNYKSIEVKNNKKLTIVADNEDRIIRTKELVGQNNSEILINRTGTGRVILYVEDRIDFSNNSIINKNGSEDALTIYYKGANAVDFSNNISIIGNVFAEKAADIVLPNNASSKGSIISGGEKISFENNASANARVIYAPNADLIIENNGEIRGTVVTNKCTMKNNATVTADNTLDTTFFDSLDWGESGPPSLMLSEQTSDWRRIGSWTTL